MATKKDVEEAKQEKPRRTTTTRSTTARKRKTPAAPRGEKTRRAQAPQFSPDPNADPSEGLNLSELKRKPAAELMELAKEYEIENPSNMRKQELIFALLQNVLHKMVLFLAKVFLKSFLMGLASYAHQCTAICPGRMTFMFPLLK